MKLTLKKDYVIGYYWHPLKAYSYGMTFNYIMSSRSDGKTTGCAIACIKNFNATGGKFIISRRYENETALCRNLFDDIIEEKVSFKGDTNGGGCYIVNKIVIGYLIPLSKANKYKGVPFPDVNFLVLDEYTLDRKNYLFRYLPNEMKVFHDLINTIFRLRTNYKVFLLGNNLDYINPFFEYHNIPDIPLGKNYINKDKDLYIEVYKSSDKLKEDKQKTPIAKLTAGTEYENFNINNELETGLKFKVRKKRDNDKLFFRLIYDNFMINIYNSYEYFFYIESSKDIIEDDYTLFIKEDTSVHYNNIKLLKTYNITRQLLDAFKRNKYIEYDKRKTGLIFEEIVNKYLR